MHLHELMGWEGPMTHRQFLAWTAWLDMEWNRPSRSDHYLMQVALEVLRGRIKQPNQAQLKHFLLGFKKKAASASDKKKRTKESVEAAAARSKAGWMAAVSSPGTGGRPGLKIRIVTPPSALDKDNHNGQ